MDMFLQVYLAIVAGGITLATLYVVLAMVFGKA